MEMEIPQQEMGKPLREELQCTARPALQEIP
jgi:hypothetical protein